MHFCIIVFDAWGKIDSGLLDGNTKWLGSFDECLNITAETNGSLPEDFTTRYCMASIPVVSLPSFGLSYEIASNKFQRKSRCYADCAFATTWWHHLSDAPQSGKHRFMML